MATDVRHLVAPREASLLGLFVLLLVPVLAKALLAFVGGYLMPFSFLTAGHGAIFFVTVIYCSNAIFFSIARITSGLLTFFLPTPYQ